MTLSSDPGLVTAVRRGALPLRDGGAVEQRLRLAMRAHGDRLSCLLRRTGIGSGESEDVVQEAFWILAQRIQSVPERAERSFLTSTVLRLASDRRRSAWHQVLHQPFCAEDWSHSLELNPEQLCEQQHTQQRLDVVLTQLSEEERSVYLLIEIESLSRSEVAQLLALPEGTVASRYARARARVERIWKELGSLSASTSLRDDYLDSSITIDNQRFHTNAWGQGKNQGPFEQRLIERQIDQAAQQGWYWYWPGFDRTVFAYPEVFIGWKPWIGGAPTDLRLPIHLRDARRLLIDYAVESRATGSHNLAISTWLSRAPSWSLSPELRPVTTELMVWTDYTSGVTPFGECVHELTVHGEHYELWRGRTQNAEHEGGWTVLTLRSPGGRRRGSLPLGALLEELAHRHFIEPEQYVTCIELGNEILGGAGTTFVERFELSL